VVLPCSQTCRHGRSVSSAIMSLPHKGSDATIVYTHLDRNRTAGFAPKRSFTAAPRIDRVDGKQTFNAR
jgi:hypothetical protein